MAVNDIFSKRQRRARGDVPELYRYDDLPRALRVQIVQLVREALSDYVLQIAQQVHSILCREYGQFLLGCARHPYTPDGDLADDADILFDFILNAEDIEQVLDSVELLFRFDDYFGQYDSFSLDNLRPRVAAAIAELNQRFREHGVGYQFESGHIIRTDSTFLHQGAVKPALALLHHPTYANAETEFLRAHEHYRHDRHEESITDALKALESTIKIICNQRKWVFDEKDTAKKLLGIVFSNGLVPPYLQNHFSALRNTLECGVPTIRNKQSGHGAGTTARDVPSHLAAYTLHLTASAILYLVECDADLPQLP